MSKVRVPVPGKPNRFQDRELYNYSVVVGGKAEFSFKIENIFVNPENQEEESLGFEPDNGAYSDFADEFEGTIYGKLTRVLIENKMALWDPKTPRMYTVTVEDEENPGTTTQKELPWSELNDDQKIEARSQTDSQILAIINQITNP